MNESKITELVSTIKNASSWQSVKAEVKEFCALSGQNFDWLTDHGFNLRQIFERILTEYISTEAMQLLNPDLTDYLDLCDYRRNVLENMPKREQLENEKGQLSSIETAHLAAVNLENYPDIDRMRFTGVSFENGIFRISAEIPGDTSRELLNISGGIPYVPVDVEIRTVNKRLSHESAYVRFDGLTCTGSSLLPQKCLYYITDTGEEFPSAVTFVAAPHEFFHIIHMTNIAIHGYWLECGELRVLFYDPDKKQFRLASLGRYATPAEKLKDLRRKTGYSQIRFGEFCGGIPLRTIQNWENGVNEIPDYVLYLIKSHLKSENLI